MRPFLSLWAKLGQDDYQLRHPVICHLVDVAAVAHELWQRVLREAPKRRIASRFGLDPTPAGFWLAFWTGAHDIGKASPCFQAKDQSGAARKALEAEGFDFPSGQDIPHGVISTRILADLLTGPSAWPAVPKTMARRVAVAVGGHHGVFPATADWDGLGRAALGSNALWQQARCEILSALAAALHLPSLQPPSAPPDDHHAAFMFLAGLTSVADWVGSNKVLFPSATGAVDLPAYLHTAPDRARRALDELGWTGWTPRDSSPRTFAGLFPKIAAPRPLQTQVEALASGLKGPGLVLIEAPMGEGKTEAALFLADHWTHRTGQQGLYLALPTQATSNQMFDRVAAFLAERYPHDRVNLHLLHGHALLSERYGELRRRADERRQSVGLTDIYDSFAPGAVVAEGWFAQNKKQGLLAPFAVGTIDQALLAVLQTKHVFVRLFGLAGKTVIFDEVHAYDAYMSTLLERLLEWLAALGCSVVLLSATLPAEKRLRLLGAYAGEAVDPAPVAYPRISVVAGGRTEAAPVRTDPARRSSVTLGWHDPDRLAANLGAALAEGGCAAVLCNTVGRAQEVYPQLWEALRPQGVEVELFHARFPFGRRQAIEERVLQRFGKPEDNPARPPKSVLVATQVIEQSLDLDFDLMASETAPIDLLLQRAGRLHRHRRERRPPRLATPQLWLLQPDVRSEVPAFGKSECVYSRYILLRSFLSLRGRTEVRLPDDLEELVEAVYGDAPPPGVNPAWETVLAESLQTLRRLQKEHRQAADDFLIRPPTFEDDILEDFCRQLEEDNPDVHPQLQAVTRLTEPTVALVLLHEHEGVLFLQPDRTGRVSEKGEPTFADARRLLGNAVAISHRSCVRHFTALDPPAAWQRSPLLRFHRLARLDGAGQTQAGGFVLRLDPELGVVIHKSDSPTETEP
jgi:CRISPR-associated endonuclease/helicase Cas3